MKVLVFANPRDASKKRFLKKIAAVPELSPTFVPEHGRCKALLMEKGLEWHAIVFFTHDQDDLAMVLSLKAHLAGSRVILVLYEIDKKTVKQGLSISPCFITNAKSDFSDIIAVLEKISFLAK